MFFISIWPMLALYIQYSLNKAINIISISNLVLVLFKKM